MGLDPHSLPDRMLNKMSKADRPPDVLTAAEAGAKHDFKLERQEQRLFANWLLLAEGRGELWYDWSATNKRVTSRVGKPDFLIVPMGRPAFWIEFKATEGRFSKEQIKVINTLMDLGQKVFIARSADEAIKFVRKQLWNPKD
jgi:hypothetical protein